MLSAVNKWIAGESDRQEVAILIFLSLIQQPTINKTAMIQVGQNISTLCRLISTPCYRRNETHASELIIDVYRVTETNSNWYEDMESNTRERKGSPPTRQQSSKLLLIIHLYSASNRESNHSWIGHTKLRSTTVISQYFHLICNGPTVIFMVRPVVNND